MTSAPSPDRVASVRAFNRFYTGVIGVLDEGLLHTPYSLTEARVLYELMAHSDALELGQLRDAVAIDAGYLSRILARFEEDGLVRREPSEDDARRRRVRLTGSGRAAAAELDRRSAAEIGALLAGLGDAGQRRLLDGMRAIHSTLDGAPDAGAIRLREPAPGDLGWIVERHGALYAEEYGWDRRFETLVARIVADFAEQRDPGRERAWIADVDGQPAGCVLSVRRDDETAQLRLLLVEPWARGMGVGTRLVDEAVAFARGTGHARVMLWTNDVLRSARTIYERAGFELLEEAPHRDFGPEVVGQTWSLTFAA